GVLAALLIALAAWPLVAGRAIDDQVTWKRVPPALTGVAADLDRMPADQRAIVLPGNLYAFYTWGGTVDPILADLSKRPIAERNAVPYGDMHGIDMLWTTDALVQQERALPGQLTPLLRLMGVGQVVSTTDDDYFRSGVFVVSRIRQNRGPALAADDPISEDAAVLNPFPDRGTEAQTVAVVHGARYIRAPFSPGYSQFAERRPFAAFDGDPQTWWAA